ncbi:MAG TPA: type II toxin-antitoxin system VapC family toxin [Desulfuromonadaceae bacterium]
MSRLLLDTDVLINLLRGKEAAREFIVSRMEEDELCCSVITVAEIMAGMRPHEEAATRRLLDTLNILEVSRSVAEKAGRYKGNTKSHALELDDCLIAATAFHADAPLATGNAKHYPMSDIRKIVVKM